MTTFVDTSALLAVLDADEAAHRRAAAAWRQLVESGETLFTTSYVLVECFALAQARLGLAATRVLVEDIEPSLVVDWVDRETHRTATQTLLATGRKKLSLVDCVSFVAMRRRGASRAFTLDRDFRDQGFETVP
jgi:predicted nucleic acid-binding protein